MPGLDGRHRDVDGRISQKRADTRLSTLRRDYPSLGAGKQGSTRLGTLRAATGKSLSKMVQTPKTK
jgi:hypothetical protein